MAAGNTSAAAASRQRYACQTASQHWLDSSATWSKVYASHCPAETYFMFIVKGQPIKLMLQMYSPDNATTFAQINAVVEPDSVVALHAMGFSYWSMAMIPLQDIARLPSYAYQLPEPGSAGTLPDPCAVASMYRQPHGGTVLLYARMVEVPAGFFLGVLGKVLTPSRALQPVRGVVKFLSGYIAPPPPPTCQEEKYSYWKMNWDVERAGVDAWQHWNQYGKGEGRVWPGTSCQECVKTGGLYMDLNADVKNICP
ncbi:hypothetical protein COO60DRAFT_414945 [Scenedesmus sp. NREL 46B-D3]|nr:hypothetical protein COO60DRAFT_414945 [Scenedesmus sp. NREL 46B-D3]